MFKKSHRALLFFFSFFCFVLRRKGVRNGICLIRVDAIGDFFVWLDSAKEYRNTFPTQKITLVGNAAWTSCAKALGYWDEVIEVDLSRLESDMKYAIAVVWKMRKLAPETTVNTSISRNLIGDSLLIATGAQQRLGSQGDLSNISKKVKRFTNFFYTRLARVNPERKAEIIRNCETFNELFDTKYQPRLPVFAPVSPTEQVAKWVNKPYIIFFPGASWNGRCWPIENFASAAMQLYKTLGWDIVLSGGDGDKALCAELQGRLNMPCVNLAGSLSLLSFAELVRNANLLVGNETSAIHIAASVQTPSVCILGGGHYGRFAPYPTSLPGIKPVVADCQMACFGCGWKCCSSDYAEGEVVPCIKNVTVKQVCELAVLALDQSEKKVG